MCLNFHSTSWRSRAISSCAGGCWVKSYNQHQGLINTPQPINLDKKIHVICWILTYQGREHLLSSTAGNRESPVSTRITCRQSLAEVICRLLAHYTHLNWKEAIHLLLLHKKNQSLMSLISLAYHRGLVRNSRSEPFAAAFNAPEWPATANLCYPQ